MKPQLRYIGHSRSPLVIVDDFRARAAELVEIAAELMPFPPLEQNYYPGLRRIITPSDQRADAYVEHLLTTVADLIAGAFEIDSFDLVEASFSMVTTPPDALDPVQRAPHFDTTDPKHLALLHYLNVPADSGTAFFRQRDTAIEVVTDANLNAFVASAKRAQTSDRASGYIMGSTDTYEQIDAVSAVTDRLIIYPGSLLHSGIIPPEMNRSADPRVGRLTANIFVRGH